MQHNLKALSASYKNSSIQVRELIALNADEIHQLYEKIRQCVPSIKEALILSTCNRTEIFYVSRQNEQELLLKLIRLVKGNDLSSIAAHFKGLDDSKLAISRLFRIAAGLESKVLGDLQIPHQLKKAYQMSVSCNFAGPFTHRLLHTIFFTNKRIIQETTFRDGAASVSYTASQVVNKATKHLRAPKVLLIGLGAIGKDVSKYLLKNDHLELFITNRTSWKSQALARQQKVRVIEFDQIQKRINDMDVIISSINSDRPLISKRTIGQNLFKDQCFIDLSVPRSIASNITENHSINLFNIDDLKSKVDHTLLKRRNAIPEVEAIIEESIATFNEWTKEVLASPVIHKIKHALEQIRKEEIARLMKKGSSHEYKAVEEVTKGMVQKIIKLKVLKLKEACRRGEATSLIDTLTDLFDLEKEQII